MKNRTETAGANSGNVSFTGPKKPMTKEEIAQKINESEAGESGDDINSEKYQKKVEKEPDRGPNFDVYSAQEDGPTSANAGVSK